MTQIYSKPATDYHWLFPGGTRLPRWLSLKKTRVCSATRGGSTCEGQACWKVWQRRHLTGRGSVWCPVAPPLHPVTHSCQSVYQYGTAGLFSCCCDYMYPIFWYCIDYMHPIFWYCIDYMYPIFWYCSDYMYTIFLDCSDYMYTIFTAVTTCTLFSHCCDYMYPIFTLLWLHVSYFHTAVTTCTLFSYCCDYMYTISIQLWLSVY